MKHLKSYPKTTNSLKLSEKKKMSNISQIYLDYFSNKENLD